MLEYARRNRIKGKHLKASSNVHEHPKKQVNEKRSTKIHQTNEF